MRTIINPRGGRGSFALVFLLVAAVAAAGPDARAALCVWTGSVSQNWSNPANWVNGLRPATGDSIEFPEVTGTRTTFNDLSPGMTLGSIILRGRNYHVSGNRVAIEGEIASIPALSTNRLLLDLSISGPVIVRTFGYFNSFELGGNISLNSQRLELDNRSLLLLSADIDDTDNFGVIHSASGTTIFTEFGRIRGKLILDKGLLIITNVNRTQHIIGTLIVGNDTDAPGSARARWDAKERTALDEVVVNRSGVVELNGPAERRWLVEEFTSLRGLGVVEINMAEVRIGGSRTTGESNFAGELRGNGIVQAWRGSAGWELSGQSDNFTGLINVNRRKYYSIVIHDFEVFEPSELTISGSLSKATIQVDEESRLRGGGAVGQLSVSNAFLRPGPGTLRVFDSFTMDDAARLEVELDGLNAGRLRAGDVNLGGATLQVTYQGGGPGNLFTLIESAGAVSGPKFQGLPEGAWLVTGDPAQPSEFRISYAASAGRDVLLERTGFFVPPALRIHSLPGGGRLLEWPLAAQGYSVERTPTLNSPTWSGSGLPVPDATATGFFIIDNGSDGYGFYRLVR